MSGQVVQKGIAIGRVKWIETLAEIGLVKTDNRELEVSALDRALDTAQGQLEGLKAKTQAEAGEHEAEIFEAHLMMLRDPSIIDQVKETISSECLTALSACEKVYDQTIRMFESLEDPYLKQRALDVRDLKKRVMGILSGKSQGSLDHDEEPVILVAEEITPSDTLEVERGKLAGMLMMTGGETSHTAILAQSLGIPAIVGCADGLNHLEEGMRIVIDGMSGDIIANPSDEALEKYAQKKHAYEAERDALKAYIGLPSVTQSGKSVEIAANIAGPEDIESVLKNDAEGVGLFRTEFIYMNRTQAPTEQEQIDIYRRILKGLGQKTVIFRTMDIGGDKEVSYLKIPSEANPFLGYRAIRYCLKETEIFKTQISAILQAAVAGNAKIMFPMIASVEEFLKAKALVQEVKEMLKAQGKPFCDDVPLGIMVEIPSAAILADDFAEHVDFFSIGTNDLTQYTLAVDRQNSEIADLYDYMHPAVLSLVKRVVQTGKEKNVWVGMCGNAAADSRMIEKLVEWGIDEISMSPAKVLESRKFVRSLA